MMSPTAMIEMVEASTETLVDVVKELHGTVGGQCVTFIQTLFKSYYTDPDFRGLARNIKPNSDVPEVGSAVLTMESKKGHVALIVAIEGNDLILAESNYSRDEVVSVGRKLSIESKYIVGYFNFKSSNILYVQ